jgi:hypothetical protein
MLLVSLAQDWGQSHVPRCCDCNSRINSLSSNADRYVAVIFEVDRENLGEVLQRTLRFQRGEIALDFAYGNRNANSSALSFLFIADPHLADVSLDDCDVVTKCLSIGAIADFPIYDAPECKALEPATAFLAVKHSLEPPCVRAGLLP